LLFNSCLQNNFFAKTDQFEEGIQYKLLTKIGSGGYGKCHLAIAEKPEDKGKLFCVKEVRLNCYHTQFYIKFARYLTLWGMSSHILVLLSDRSEVACSHTFLSPPLPFGESE